MQDRWHDDAQDTRPVPLADLSDAGTPEVGTPTPATRPAEESNSVLRTLWLGLVELGETVLPAIVIAVLINLFLAQATRVYGSSMEPNLYTDQRLVVEKVSYRLHTPHRGDVVVLRMPERGPELLIILVVVLLLFGAAKLPSLARSIGASAKEFKKGVEEGVPDEDATADSEKS